MTSPINTWEQELLAAPFPSGSTVSSCGTSTTLIWAMCKGV
ncbi:hypothetical protein [Xenorhabdus siamensis]